MLGLLEYTQKPEVKPHVPDGLPPPVPLMISIVNGRFITGGKLPEVS
jgi:hypothetical protein